MKMKADAGRIILAAVLILFSIISLIGLLFSLGIVELGDIFYRLSSLLPRFLVGVISLMFLIGSIYLIGAFFFRGKQNLTVVQSSELGEVRVTLAALENLIKKATQKLEGVTDIKPEVFLGDKDKIDVNLTLSVYPDTDIQQNSVQIQTMIRDYIRSYVGIEVDTINISVTRIASNVRFKAKTED